jgi:ferrous iron transport protein B
MPDAACHPASPGARRGDPADRRPVVALVGRPNVGKSTFLARASRRFVETANAPGTTVALERRLVTVGGREAWLVDLPGTRSLDDEPVGDDPFWTWLLAAAPDAILVVVDAGNLARHLPLAIACRDLGLPVVIAANLVDEAARRGISVDVGRLGQLLNAPTHATCGRTGEGVDAALGDAVRLATIRRAVKAGGSSPRATIPAPVYSFAVEEQLRHEARVLSAEPRSLGAAAVPESLQAGVLAGLVSPRGGASIRLASSLEPVRWAVAAGWAGQAEHRRDVPEPLADRVARWVTAPWPGIPVFLGVSFAMFLAVIYVGGLLATLLGTAWGATVTPFLAAVVPAVVPVPALANALTWALDGGVFSMLAVGIPYVLTFYLMLAALEDSGYLTSAAVLMDRVLGVLGLPGRAAIPLLAAAGCNVPAIYGTRVLRTRRERVLASFLVTLTPCSARSAVIIAALAPYAGVPAAIAAFGVVGVAAIAAGVGANAMIPGRQPSLVLELAPLRVPILRHVAHKAWWRFRGFVVTAAPIMIVGSLVLGLVYEAGLWQGIADAIGPATGALLGLPAIAGVAMAFAFLRKELALQLLLVFAAVELGHQAALGELMNPSQLFVYAVVSSLSIPCIATLAALRGELGGRAAAAISLGSLVLAIGIGAVLARVLGIA